jgi:hypothetical protein
MAYIAVTVKNQVRALIAQFRAAVLAGELKRTTIGWQG